MCGHANEHCPVFPGNTKVVHIGFDDPYTLTKGVENNEEVLRCYRRVRDEIKEMVDKLPEVLYSA